MIGIIGAMDIETEGIKALIKDKQTLNISGIDFVSGKINGKDTVVAKCGCGKVNAALCTEAMILNFRPDAVINTGVAGALDKRLGIADIAIAKDVVQGDYDTTPLGEPLGFLSEINMVHIPCDKRISDILEKCAKKQADTTVLTGTIATTDKFLNSDDIKNYLTENFGAISGEMEGGAIGHVCHINKVAFGVLRAMSDSGDGDSHLDFEEFKKIASKKTIEIISDFINEF